MTFNNWIDTFLEEKGIPQDTILSIETDNGLELVPVKLIVDFIKVTENHTKEQIKKQLVTIDFEAGSVEHFLKHIFKATQAVGL